MLPSVAFWVTLVLSAPDHRSVVAYLVSATPDSAVEVPEEALPDRATSLHPWQWHIFDPASRRDTLLLELPSFPTRARWDPGYGFLEYVVADRIERVPWRFGARPVARIPLPKGGGLCDFWADPDGHGWHAITLGEIGSQSVATRWDRDSSGVWRAFAESGVYPYEGCRGLERLHVGAERLRRGAAPPPAIRLETLLDSMCVGYHRDSTLRTVLQNEDGGPGWWNTVPAGFDPNFGLEYMVVEGDTPHAVEPIQWVDRRRRINRTIYRRGDSHGGEPGQVGFQGRGSFMLVAAEYSGGYPTVVDMRTGEVLLRIDRPSARAVWVPAPR